MSQKLMDRARQMDAADGLSEFRSRFAIPRGRDGKPVVYLAGNSLGLMPLGVKNALEVELEDWSNLAVDAHFDGRHPWYSYHEELREPAAALVGAKPSEVVVMNGLTVNLNLMMLSFYRPTATRYKILLEAGTFPSDLYALQSQTRFHGFDPAEALIEVEPGDGATFRTQDFVEAIERNRDSLALVLVSGVHFFTGQYLDIPAICGAARKAGIPFGVDLAHTAGNLPLKLHDWDVDFAVWCSYKYLNSGPGAVAGCFVHERHGTDNSLPRLAGWWGNDPATRFLMNSQRQFVPVSGADGWQMSNPPILAMAPVRVSLEMFKEAGMDRLREKSVRLTGLLEEALQKLPAGSYELLTPRDPSQRGCQLSIRIKGNARDVQTALQKRGVVADHREPDVIRLAPVPMYNTFTDVVAAADALAEEIR